MYVEWNLFRILTFIGCNLRKICNSESDNQPVEKCVIYLFFLIIYDKNKIRKTSFNNLNINCGSYDPISDLEKVLIDCYSLKNYKQKKFKKITKKRIRSQPFLLM